MPEIKLSDLQEVKNPALENFRDIAPENGTTAADARGYWNEVFNDRQGEEQTGNAEVAGDRPYYDDNGKLYRKGDNLEPDSKFEVRGYTYTTDKLGRVTSAEGKLRERAPEHNPEQERRNMDKMDAVGKGDQKEGDDRGHLIALRFDGSGGIENLSPMASELNKKDYAALENKLADAVAGGADVRLKVEPKYEGDSNRPAEYKVSYSIDGERDVVTFRNGREE